MERPPAPPEAVVIRLAREAAGIRMAEAAKRAGVSVARWAQIETGSEMRHGGPSPVTGRAGTIAKMAHAVGVGPERLASEGERPDAAEILREILRQREDAAIASGPEPPRPGARRKPPGLPFVTPEMEALMEPHLARVEIAVEVARRRHPGEQLTGAKVFPGSPADADSWDRLAAGGREPGAIAWRLAAVLAWEAEMAEAEAGGTVAGLMAGSGRD